MASSNPRVIGFAGGGSAGHALPAALIAEELRQKVEVQPLFYGRKGGIEATIAEQFDIPFRAVPSSRLRRYASLKNAFMPFVNLYGVGVGLVAIRRDRPRALFSKGSFSSVPIAIAARMLGTPVIIHESDRSLGLANRIIGSFAHKILLSNRATALPQRLSNKAQYVGQIVRRDLAEGDAFRFLRQFSIKRERPLLLIFGGSSGATYINGVVTANLSQLLELVEIFHIVGEGNLDQAFSEVDGYVQVEYLNTEMIDALSAADIVLCRSGANTVAELLQLRKTSILVPLSTEVSRGDQAENAQSFIDAGGQGAIVSNEDLATAIIPSVAQLVSVPEPDVPEARYTAGSSDATSANELIVEILSAYLQPPSDTR